MKKEKLRTLERTELAEYARQELGRNLYTPENVKPLLDFLNSERTDVWESIAFEQLPKESWTKDYLSNINHHLMMRLDQDLYEHALEVMKYVYKDGPQKSDFEEKYGTKQKTTPNTQSFQQAPAQKSSVPLIVGGVLVLGVVIYLIMK